MNPVATNEDARAVRELAHRDPAIPALEVVLDRARLSEALGDPIDVTRIRYKPGTSIVAAIVHRGEHRWIAGYAHDGKLAKALRRGAWPVEGMPSALVGDALTDRKLLPALRALDRAWPGALHDAQVLRYNPHRRLVLEIGEWIVKVTADDSAAAGEAVQRAVAARGVPALAPTSLAPTVSTTPRWGHGDLATQSTRAHAHQAGAALAALHLLPVAAVPAASTTDPSAALVRELDEAVEAVSVLAPELRERARRIARVVPTDSSPVLTHGDFSADQVLTSPDGVRLIDFDRARLAPAMRDVGEFVAAEALASLPGTAGPAARTPLGDALCAGYRSAGGEIDRTVLPAWIAAGILTRAAEPFRHARAGWREALEDAIERAEGVLQ